MGQAASGHPAGRARPVPLAQPRGRVGDGGGGARRAPAASAGRAKPGELVDVEEQVSVDRAPAVRLARRDQARQRAGRERACGGGPPRAGRGRLDGRVHRLPAAAWSAGGDRGGRRLRDARLRPAHRSARERDGAHERAALTPRDAAESARAGHGALPDLATIDVSFISLAKVLGAVLGCLAERLRRARAGQAAVRGRPRSGSARGGWCARRRDRRAALVSVGEAARRAGRGGARLSLLGAAGAEGQPRDVRLAGRARSRGRRVAGAGTRLERMAARRSHERWQIAQVRAVREITVFTHRRPEDTTRGPGAARRQAAAMPA